jgi:hypothetical protein
METEIWKDILEVGGMYQISNFGRVKSKEKVIERSNGGRPVMPERIMKSSRGNQGLLVITLKCMGKNKVFTIHRLVATYFIPNPENCDVVKFKDGDKMNVHVSNLYWISSGKYKSNKSTPNSYVKFDELSEMWDVIVSKQHFASYENKEKAEKVLQQEIIKRNNFNSEVVPLYRSIIPQRARKIFRTQPIFIFN